MLTLADVERMKNHPNTKSCIIEYETDVTGKPQPYSDFVTRINDELDAVVSKLEQARDYYNKQSEDFLTNFICGLLQQKSINATHGDYSSGETDLKITHGPYEWIGEAKWWEQDENAFEGMRQLSERYSCGSNNGKSNGGILLYNRTGNAADKLERLQSLYMSKGAEFSNIKVSSDNKCSLSFNTEHHHSASGLPYSVRHKLINLYHVPTDKSARNRK